MVRLTQIFKTHPNDPGVNLDLDISIDYDPEQDSISDVFVKVWSYGHRIYLDISNIFEATPFAELIKGINWAQVYREKKEASYV